VTPDDAMFIAVPAVGIAETPRRYDRQTLLRAKDEASVRALYVFEVDSGPAPFASRPYKRPRAALPELIGSRCLD
jgi:hypothetical protein